MIKKILFTFYIACLGSTYINSQNLKTSIESAEENKTNLENVLKHYQDNNDQQNYNAASFLIENMPIHYSVEYIWLSDDNKIINFNETTYDDIEKAKSAFEKLNDSINIKPYLVISKDTEIITSELLIDNIDLAFKAWIDNPWSSSYDYDTFKEYILPYRSLTEPLQNWRSEYKLLYERIGVEVLDKSDPVEVCTKIIEEIKHFDFVMDRFDPTPLLGPMELLFWREGNCPDLANVSLFACRALGVAVTFDFTPYFAASSNKHFWNTVINKEGEHIPFNGNQDLPYIYNANYRRMGKIFRNTFSAQKDNLSFIIDENMIPEDFLKSKYLIDVTEEYVDVNNINWNFKESADNNIAYITVFNRGSWKIIHWSQINENNAVFTDMGRDIVYLPGIFIDKKMIFEQSPILLNQNGEQTILNPDFSSTFQATLSRKNEAHSEYEDYNPFEFENGKLYSLYVWNNRWEEIEKQTAKDYKITFKKIPNNGLFLMAKEQPDFFERIFTIDKETSKITWY